MIFLVSVTKSLFYPPRWKQWHRLREQGMISQLENLEQVGAITDSITPETFTATITLRTGIHPRQRKSSRIGFSSPSSGGSWFNCKWYSWFNSTKQFHRSLHLSPFLYRWCHFFPLLLVKFQAIPKPKVHPSCQKIYVWIRDKECLKSRLFLSTLQRAPSIPQVPHRLDAIFMKENAPKAWEHQVIPIVLTQTKAPRAAFLPKGHIWRFLWETLFLAA